MLDDMKITSHLAIPLGATISLIVLARYFKTRDSLRKSELPYPPGPKGLPLIGNVLDVPRGVPIWEGFTRMAKTYRTSMVIRSSREIIIEPSHRGGYHVSQYVWNRLNGSELERDHRGFVGQEVGNLLGQGGYHVPRLFGRG